MKANLFLPVLLVTTTSAIAAPTLTPLETNTQVTSISGDGTVVVGVVGGAVFRWTKASGLVVIGGNSNGNPSVSSDGTTIAGYEKERCVMMDVDGLALPLRWDGAPPIAVGTKVALRLYFRDATMFALSVGA